MIVCCAVILLLNILFVAAQADHVRDGNGGVYVQNTDFKITAPDETIFCTTDYTANGCLFKTQILIESRSNKEYTVRDKLNLNRDVKVQSINEQNKKISRNLNTANGKDFQTNNRAFGKRTTEVIDIEFWAKESGKYNYSVIYNGIELKLDPFFNVTPNSKNPLLGIDFNLSNAVSASSTYSSIGTATFNLTDISDVSYITSLQVEKTSGTGQQNASFLLLFDGVPVAERTRTLEGSEKSIITFGFVNDSLPVGLHTIELQHKVQSGTIESSDIGLQVTTFSLPNGTVLDHQRTSTAHATTSNTFTPAATGSFTIEENNSDVAVFVNLQSASLTGSQQVFYYFEFDGEESHHGSTRMESTSDKQIFMLNDVFLNKSAGSKSWTLYSRNHGASETTTGGGFVTLVSNQKDNAFVQYDSNTENEVTLLTNDQSEYITSALINATATDDIVAIFTSTFQKTGSGKRFLDFILSLNNELNASPKIIEIDGTNDVQTVNIMHFFNDVNVSGVHNVSVHVIAENGGTQTVTGSNSSLLIYEISELTGFVNLTDDTPIVVLNSPANNSVIDPMTNQTFNCEAIDDTGITNVTFYWNETGTLIPNGSQQTNAEIDIDVLFNRTIPSGVIEWSCMARDLGSNEFTADSFVFSGTDIINPVIVTADFANNSLVNKQETNQSINYTITDNVGVLNTSWYIFNSSGIVIESDIVLNSSQTSYTVFDVVDISDFGQGTYYINHVAYDTSGNRDDELIGIQIIDFSLLLTLTTPINNSELFYQTYYTKQQDQSFVYNVNNAGTCSLYINESLIKTQNAVAGENKFELELSGDQYMAWYVACTILGINATSETRENDVVFQLVDEEYSAGSCPNDSIENVLMFTVLLLILAAFYMLGFFLKNGMVATLAAIGMMFASFYIMGCIVAIGIIAIGISGIMIAVGISRGVNRFE